MHSEQETTVRKKMIIAIALLAVALIGVIGVAVATHSRQICRLMELQL